MKLEAPKWLNDWLTRRKLARVSLETPEEKTARQLLNHASRLEIIHGDYRGAAEIAELAFRVQSGDVPLKK